MTLTAAPLLGLGVVLDIGTQGGSPTYTAVGKIRNIKPPSLTWGTEDVTTIDNGTTVKTFLKTLQDGGEMDVSVLWESADPGQTAVIAAYATSSNSTDGATFPFKLVFPINAAGGQTTSGDTFAFSGLVVNYGPPEIQADKNMAWNFKVKITTTFTYTEGS